MKFNSKELVDLSFGEATIEGRLHHKKINGGYTHSAFKEKWFKLRSNILFYFNLSETGQIFDKKPVGAFILENVIVQYEMNSEVPFSFSFYFNDEVDKKHLFSGRTQENINKWVDALKQASYEFWRCQLILLQEKLKLITGQDPLLMYPKNEGCKFVKDPSTSKVKDKTGSKTVEQSSKSQFYAIEETETDDGKHKSKEPNRDEIPSKSSSLGENQAPVRPARTNKPKPEVNCGKLIDI